MSEIMLLGALRAPYPSDPGELGIVEWLGLRARAREAADEIERLQRGLEAVTHFHQVTHCHAAARAALAGMDARKDGEPGA